MDEGEQQETIREIRVHGNAFLSDEDVIKLAGVSLGAPLQPADVDAISERLKDSGRFETVEVRKRYRSLTDTTDVALVLLVHERPGVRKIEDGPSAVLNPVRRIKNRLMFLPILSYADGYGFTYGGRVSTVSLLGIGERLSVPLTWGGTRRAAARSGFGRQLVDDGGHDPLGVGVRVLVAERHRRTDADIDRQVIEWLQQHAEANKELVSQGIMSMLGKDDLFTKAAVESSIEKMDEAVGQPIPTEARQWLGMMGFRIVINDQGEVVDIELPAAAVDED